MEIIEIGREAKAALARSAGVETLMTFSRGQVLRTSGGDIIWCDSEPLAFSPRGITIAAPEEAVRPVVAGRAEIDTHRQLHLEREQPGITAAASARFASFDAAIAAALDGAIGQFLSAMKRGEKIAAAAPFLLGLGRGLTPSGDDFLGGFLAVRAHTGRGAIIETDGTNEISRARLEMHMRGEGTRAEMLFLEALLEGRDHRTAAIALRRLGASSGDDFIRGACAAVTLDAERDAFHHRGSIGLTNSTHARKRREMANR